ncbi:MAG: type II toxin-antitoxin system RelE/ParE family toxin [Gemmatimonadetes bacterium]|nr:type II toxin-antitoxin system RelE/ParE family toxin [Gemmatimonadota bacterium]MYG20799.1 type II toxin-antitoxin system RelE/ParE family toxin [Gemmatimonadota bacterium]MYJ38707.1 type II toxin-antitoxin system RelE/ParE family toxin [Gemmatimonadota bacterium]
MGRYEVEVSRTAEKQLRKLPRDDQERVVHRMLLLTEDPFPQGARKLTGYDDVYRVRVGRYRILYSVSQGRLVIVILKVGHRKDAYRRGC